MHAHPVRHFRLSPRERGRGVSCDASGAFIDGVPLLKRVTKSGTESWTPRSSEGISADLSARYGLPVDASSKLRGIAAIARALNDGEVARAQLAALFLRFPESPPLAKSPASRGECARFIRELHSENLLKATWEPVDHPRWPAGTEDSQGGRFAPKGEQLESIFGNEDPVLADSAIPTAQPPRRLRSWSEVATDLNWADGHGLSANAPRGNAVGGETTSIGRVVTNFADELYGETLVPMAHDIPGMVVRPWETVAGLSEAFGGNPLSAVPQFEAAVATTLNEAADALAEAETATRAPSLPSYEGGKTTGILQTENENISFQSGMRGPGSLMPPGSPGFDIVTRTHVEGHAAAYMQQQGITNAHLYINNPTICPSCTKLLPRMLAPDSKLNIVTPNWAITTFTGIVR